MSKSILGKSAFFIVLALPVVGSYAQDNKLLGCWSSEKLYWKYTNGSAVESEHKCNMLYAEDIQVACKRKDGTGANWVARSSYKLYGLESAIIQQLEVNGVKETGESSLPRSLIYVFSGAQNVVIRIPAIRNSKDQSSSEQHLRREKVDVCRAAGLDARPSSPKGKADIEISGKGPAEVKDVVQACKDRVRRKNVATMYMGEVVSVKYMPPVEIADLSSRVGMSLGVSKGKAYPATVEFFNLNDSFRLSTENVFLAKDAFGALQCAYGGS